MKKVLLIIVFLFGGVFFSLKDSTFPWLPSEIRSLIVQTKFIAGDCLEAKEYWGVNPKQVIGLKFKGKRVFYLLRDRDQYQHDQILKAKVVEKIANKINCR
jgi:hypothetical protein